MIVEKKISPYNFEDIYVSYFSRMKYFALEYVLSEEDAENIVQDVFTELWEKKEILTYNINLVAFLFTSIKNKCIDLLRHRVVVQEAVSVMQEEYQATLRVKLASLELFDQSMLLEQDIERIITEAIDSLPEKCREIFIKSKIEGKKQKEIAEELNISLKTVENQMNIAYKKIRVELKDYLPLLIFLFAN
ncbi:RNA polymerase sigma-70 factor [Parabacteroides acidifaciens]|uniref:RNA polymerase sigma-70 factor n=1 Tax=Parabacteroides acidifaciens TaxID=2290935 RepID=A0A3D8HD31_9BACT|nr:MULTISPECIES: RNA polymerase sigma-70 factor [Parabacteroides]MBC8602473.1 RNA polymerase sigma-70 factor [Parabacteroides acidifaciens]RDU48801.1 RNA polymerase sigma-70 factor [Parabacteroides acidifaciens]RHO71826.1 RNA polymerase sigma-70 factor [Parabacteroides sp. AF48-14]RHR55646.1 RNA polymerase sigma-70 factor [Parabacteroides sp. AF17-28]